MPEPAQVVELVAVEHESVSTDSGVELVVGDIAVRVQRGFDAETLARVLEVVVPC